MLGLLVGLVLIAVAFVFATIFFAVFAAVALVVGGWLWWRTRHLRRRAAEARGVTIEGEYREEREVVRRLEEPASAARRDPGAGPAP